jgi:hypothetical protein
MQISNSIRPGSYPDTESSAVYAPARSVIIEPMIGITAILITASLFSLSPMGLAALGWNYDGAGGSNIERFHPSSYLIVVLSVLLACRRANPVASFLEQFARDTPMTLFVGIWFALFLHSLFYQDLAFTTLLDTFLMPVLLVLAVRQLGFPLRSNMMWIVHLLMNANALLGIVEFTTGWRLTPFVAAGVPIVGDWRSTALLGHPLANALLTGCYVMLLLLGGGGRLSDFWRVLIIGLQCSVMIPFGGRASLVLLAVFVVVAFCWSILKFLIGGKVRLIHLTFVILLGPLLLGSTFYLLEIGFFDRFIDRFLDDRGSSEARVLIFELFQAFTWDELLLGPPQELLKYRMAVYQIEFGIESLWLSLAFSFGILPAIIFSFGLLLFFASVISDCKKSAILVVLHFLAINTTFLGLGGKTIGLSILSLMMVLVLPKGSKQAGQAPMMPGVSPMDRGQAC